MAHILAALSGPQTEILLNIVADLAWRIGVLQSLFRRLVAFPVQLKGPLLEIINTSQGWRLMEEYQTRFLPPPELSAWEALGDEDLLGFADKYVGLKRALGFPVGANYPPIYLAALTTRLEAGNVAGALLYLDELMGALIHLLSVELGIPEDIVSSIVQGARQEGLRTSTRFPPNRLIYEVLADSPNTKQAIFFIPEKFSQAPPLILQMFEEGKLDAARRPWSQRTPINPALLATAVASHQVVRAQAMRRKGEETIAKAAGLIGGAAIGALILFL